MLPFFQGCFRRVKTVTSKPAYGNAGSLRSFVSQAPPDGGNVERAEGAGRMIESAARTLAKELVSRREEINRELSRNGVRSGVYKDGEYHDRLFPYDPVPRIIESDEFDRLEAGLKQRVQALNAYLNDIYSDKQIVHDGVIPEEFVYTSAGYYPQVNGVTPPGGVFVGQRHDMSDTICRIGFLWHNRQVALQQWISVRAV